MYAIKDTTTNNFLKRKFKSHMAAIEFCERMERETGHEYLAIPI